MEKRNIKRIAKQILKEQTKTPVIGLKYHTIIPRIDVDNLELYEEFKVEDTVYVVWQQEQDRPRVAKRELINYVR